MSDEQGYLMVALLVAMSVMAIMMGAALPAWHTLAQREKEAELVFRGEQYGRAIGLYQRKFANAPVPSIDVLVEQRFLRKKYKDPITNDDFEVLSPGASLPGPAQLSFEQQGQGSGQQTAGRTGAPTIPQGGRGAVMPTGGQGGRGTVATFAQGGRGGVVAGIVGVTSKSPLKSLRLYNGRDTYNQWVFMPVAQSARVGGAGPGAQGGRGADGRGGRGGVGTTPQGGRGLPQGGRGPVQPPPAGGVIR